MQKDTTLKIVENAHLIISNVKMLNFSITYCSESLTVYQCGISTAFHWYAILDVISKLIILEPLTCAKRLTIRRLK